jgi:Mg-chelatase subunit ChlD
MKTLLKSILVLPFICQTAIAAQSASAQPQSSNSVTIYLTATSPKGQLLALSASDLSIQENKQPAHIDRVDCGKPEPLLLAVLIDTSGSRVADRNLIAHYDALKKFLASTLGKGDTAYLISFADQPHQLTPPTADLTILNAALDQLRSVPPKGKTAVYDTLEMASKQNLAVDHVRRVILMIGDFGDNASKIDVSKASSAALESRSTLFLMMDQNDSPPQVRNRTLEEEGSVEDLFKVAREAGGQTLTIESPTGFPAALDIIHNVLNHSCRVEYTPASPIDSKPLIRLSVKIIHGHAVLYAPQARPARTSATSTAHN